MALIWPSRDRTTPPRSAAPGSRGARAALALIVSAGLLLLGACGLDVQTMQPYTPAEGVNADVGDPPVEVRNLMILSREDGSGFLSGTMTAAERDALSSVSGAPVKPDGSKGQPFTAAQADSVALGNNTVVVLTDRSPIEIASPDLLVGGIAEMTLVFSTAGSLTLLVPVVDADQAAYETITPTPSPSS